MKTMPDPIQENPVRGRQNNLSKIESKNTLQPKELKGLTDRNDKRPGGYNAKI